MTQYSLTKDPNADHVVAVSKDLTATPIEITKDNGHETVTFQKDSAIKVRVVKQNGGTL